MQNSFLCADVRIRTSSLKMKRKACRPRYFLYNWSLPPPRHKIVPRPIDELHKTNPSATGTVIRPKPQVVAYLYSLSLITVIVCIVK